MSNRNNTYSKRCYGKSPPPPEPRTGARKQHRSAQVGTNICQFSRYATEFGVNFKSVVHATCSSIRRNKMRFLRRLFLKTKQQLANTVLFYLWETRRPYETTSTCIVSMSTLCLWNDSAIIINCHPMRCIKLCVTKRANFSSLGTRTRLFCNSVFSKKKFNGRPFQLQRSPFSSDKKVHSLTANCSWHFI